MINRVKSIESYGTGLQRIKESYADTNEKPFWEVGPNAFVVTLPKRNSELKYGSNDVPQELAEWMEKYETFTGKELENHLDQLRLGVIVSRF